MMILQIIIELNPKDTELRLTSPESFLRFIFSKTCLSLAPHCLQKEQEGRDCFIAPTIPYLINFSVNVTQNTGTDTTVTGPPLFTSQGNFHLKQSKPEI